ncbi:glycosyltransferase family 4 protein [Methyloparacoccus murrellii]
MKILLVHNHYGSSAPSGENQVFEAEEALLRSRGHEVLEFTRHSDEIRGQGAFGTLKGALATPWNPFAMAALRRVVDELRPDVVHVHNTFPLLSPGIFHAIGRRTARVLTLHNYRLFCPAAIPLRAGRVCTDCLDRRSVWPALRHGCYRNSRAATLPLAASVALHRQLGTWTRQVEAFIALTDFQRDRLVAAGLPAERVSIKPQFYDDPPTPVPWDHRESRVVFVGRLGEEKGVRHLIEAWLAWGRDAPRLELIGQGPERGIWEDRVRAAGLSARVVFTGQLPFAEVQQRIARSRLLVLPSVWFEGFPMVIREAFALGVPVAASNLGSMASLVRSGHNGVLFEPGHAPDLLRVVRDAWQAPSLLPRLGAQARADFDTRYTAEANHAMLMTIYENAIALRRQRLAA